MRQIPVTAGADIRVSGRGNQISIMQGKCAINFHNDDVVHVFDLVAQVLDDNKRFSAQHESRHHKGKTEHADAE